MSIIIATYMAAVIVDTGQKNGMCITAGMWDLCANTPFLMHHVCFCYHVTHKITEMLLVSVIFNLQGLNNVQYSCVL